MPYLAKVDCFYSSRFFPAGSGYKAGEIIPDSLVDPDTLPEFVAVVEEIPAESPPEVPEPMSLGQLQARLDASRPSVEPPPLRTEPREPKRKGA